MHEWCLIWLAIQVKRESESSNQIDGENHFTIDKGDFSLLIIQSLIKWRNPRKEVQRPAVKLQNMMK